MKRARRAEQESIVVPVTSRKVLCDSCRREVGLALEHRNLSFQQTDTLADGSEVYSILGPEATRAGEKYKFGVLRFLAQGSAVYWIAVSLSLSPPGVRPLHLRGVNIILMEGPLAGLDKRRLLRIDWDCRQAATESRHAQPHWHVYLDWEVTPEVQPGGFQEEDAIREFVPGGDDGEAAGPIGGMVGASVPATTDTSTVGELAKVGPDVARFHFALAANWHDDQGHSPTLTEEQVPKWISGCITYTREQLVYLHEKASKRQN